jgi:transcription elongation factor Elf1
MATKELFTMLAVRLRVCIMTCPFCGGHELVQYQVNADMIHVICKTCNEEWVE